MRAPTTKFEPFTVNVKLALPTGILEGDRDVGAGIELSGPPPILATNAALPTDAS